MMKITTNYRYAMTDFNEPIVIGIGFLIRAAELAEFVYLATRRTWPFTRRAFTGLD
jgi:hypothetical protein